MRSACACLLVAVGACGLFPWKASAQLDVRALHEASTNALNQGRVAEAIYDTDNVIRVYHYDDVNVKKWAGEGLGPDADTPLIEGEQRRFSRTALLISVSRAGYFLSLQPRVHVPDVLSWEQAGPSIAVAVAEASNVVHA